MNTKKLNLEHLRLGYCVMVIFVCLVSAGYFISGSKAQNGDKTDISKKPTPLQTELDKSFERLINLAREKGSVRVIIGLKMDFTPVGNLNPAERQRQQTNIKQIQNDLLETLAQYYVREVKQFDYMPYLAAEIDAAALEKMRQHPQIISIQEDEVLAPTLAESVPLVGAPAAWSTGFTGSGWSVAILDTGVDKFHSFLSGKVISEACYSTNNAGANISSVCPGGVSQSTASGSGVNCNLSISGCNHGTHVAGIAAGTNGSTVHGVGRGANVIAVQVFSRFGNQSDCGSTTAPCALSFQSDQILGLERVLTLSSSTNIAAVNMSLGGGQFTSNCDTQPQKPAIDNLRSVGIATVISSGNNGFTNALGAPSCISTAVSVGSTGDGSLGATVNVVSSFSNSASFLHLLAPGQWINSSVPNNGFSNIAGTSMAAPHVAGAWAVLKQKKPNATVTEILNAFTSTGLSITDTRNGIIKPRIRVDSALAAIPGVAGNVQFSSSNYSVNENGGTATITVTRTGGTGAFNVNYATSNGTATAGQDYSATSGTLSFGTNDTSRTFTVTILDDTLVEGNETVNLSLSSPTNGATLGSPSTAVLTIIDNDTACTYSLNPTSQSVPQAGGTYSVQVTTQSGCGWTAVSNSFADSGNVNVFETVAPNLPQLFVDKTDSATINNNAVMTSAFSEGFDNISNLPASGWFTQNNSVPIGSTGWFQGNSATFPAQGGAATSYIGTNFNNTTGTNTISNWLLTPNTTFNNGDIVRFWTRTVTGNTFPDRLQVRLSTNGTSTNVGSGATGVGDFTRLLIDINPTYQTGGAYPEVWTQYTINLSGLSGASSGRMAFRYFVENGGPTGANSNFIGIDTFSYTPTTSSGWITINPPGSGTGSGSFSYTAAANTTGSQRTGTISVQGQIHTVTQSATSPTAGNVQFSSSTYSVNENAGTATITVTRTGGTAAFNVNYTTSNGTATAGQDYSATSGTLSFAANENSKTFNITILDDTLVEGNETVNLTLSNPTNGATLGSPSTAVLTIIDNDVSTTRAKLFDFDGDSRADISIYRPSNGQWWINRSSNGTTFVQTFGNSLDKIVPADYTGDGKTDIAIWRPSTGEWFILRSENSTFYSGGYGMNGDVPVSGYFDSDNRADITVFRPSNGTWYTRLSSNNTDLIRQFGTNGDIPLVANFDGDGFDDVAIFRPSNGQWWLNRSSAGVIVYQFGNSADKPVPGDYTGDGKADVTIWRPSNGVWYVLRSENATYYENEYGTNGDIPLLGDFNGNGRADPAVFRPSNNTWFVQGVFVHSFGASGDKPVPSAFVP